MRATSRLLTALAALSGIVVGCSPPPLAGSAHVGVRFNAVSARSVTRVTLTVGNPPSAGITTDLANQDLVNNLTWTGFVGPIPADTGRPFHVEAVDGMGSVLYSGDTTTDIVAGKTAMVFLVLQPKNPDAGFNSYLPVIDSLTASANAVSPGDPVHLSVAAHSPNTPPDPLTYAWAASCGSLTKEASTSPTWTAPAIVPPQPSPCEITVTVSDQHDGRVAASLDIVY